MDRRNGIRPFDATGRAHVEAVRNTCAYVGRRILCDHQWQEVRRGLALSKRQFEIVQRLSDDMTEAVMAEELGVSQHTIHSHLTRLYAKANARSRLQLVIQILTEFVETCDKAGHCAHSDVSPLQLTTNKLN